MAPRGAVALLFALLLAAAVSADVYYNGGGLSGYADGTWPSGTFAVCNAVYMYKYDYSSTSAIYLLVPPVRRAVVINDKCYYTGLVLDSNGVATLVAFNGYSKVAYYIVMNTNTGGVNVTSFSYSSIIVYTNTTYIAPTTTIIGFTQATFNLFWKAFGGGQGVGGTAAVIYAPIGNSVTIYNNSTKLKSSTSFPFFAVLLNVTWTHVTYNDVFGNAFTAKASNDVYIFTTNKYFLASQVAAQASTTTTTTTQPATTSTVTVTVTPVYTLPPVTYTPSVTWPGSVPGALPTWNPQPAVPLPPVALTLSSAAPSAAYLALAIAIFAAAYGAYKRLAYTMIVAGSIAMVVAIFLPNGQALAAVGIGMVVLGVWNKWRQET